MNEETNMGEEQYSEEFLSGNPTRAEVNQYMNNVYMAVNNSVGLYQGYMVSALVDTLVASLNAAGITLDREQFMKDFLVKNGELAQLANEKMKEMAAGEAEEPAPAARPTPPTPEIKLV
jgi:hypothetical protein